MTTKFKLFFFFLVCAVSIFKSENAMAQQSCIQKQMSCTSSCNPNSNNYGMCVNSCNDDLVTCADTTETDCLSSYSACNLGCTGDDIMSCLQVCISRNQVCKDAERRAKRSARERRRQSRPVPTPTPTPAPPVIETQPAPANSVEDILGKIKNGGLSTSGNSSENSSRTIESNSEKDIRKKLGTDLETMKAVSDLGGRNARTCVGAVNDSEGFIYVKNICGKSVNFGYCYDDWVPKRPTASNPFKCDTTGKLAWGGASNVRGSQEWRAPLQSDSVSRKLIYGPCMAEVFYNDRKYSYLHSRRTAAAFRGGTGKYKCIYIKSAGQD